MEIGVGTQYTLDIEAGLSQVLSDGGSTFLYGMSRIAQADPGVRAYFLGDALNSARQMVDNAGQIGLGRAYEPFGDPLSISGEMQTAYGFAGEWRDTTGLVNLRARYYAPTNGRFLQPDPWEGEKTNPPTQSKYLYALNSPILITDPSGRVCIGGYSLGSGEGCSAAYQGQVKGAIDKWARLMGNPEFLRGLVYEFLEALIVVGPDTQRAVLNHMLKESPALEAALQGTALYLAAECGDKSLVNALNIISNGAPGSQYWYEGRALGRMIAITIGLAAMGVGGLGAAGGISFSIFSGPAAVLGVSETVVAGAVAVGGARVVGSAVLRELDDHLILMAVRGEIGGDGGGGSLRGREALDDLYSRARPKKGTDALTVRDADAKAEFERIAEPSSVIPHRSKTVADQGGLEGDVPGGGRIFYRPKTGSESPAIDFSDVSGYPPYVKIHFP